MVHQQAHLSRWVAAHKPLHVAQVAAVHGDEMIVSSEILFEVILGKSRLSNIAALYMGLFSLSSFPLTLSQTHSPHHNSSLMPFCCNPHKSQYPDTSVVYWHRTSIYPVRPCWQVVFSLPVSLTFFFVYTDNCQK